MSSILPHAETRWTSLLCHNTQHTVTVVMVLYEVYRKLLPTIKISFNYFWCISEMIKFCYNPYTRC